MFHLPLLNDELYFPPLENTHSSGLVAAGGDLSVHRLIFAYSSGIFPWFDTHDPLLWWSPDPRFVLFIDEFKLSKRQERAIRHANFHITANTAFNHVINYCARVPRKKISLLDEEDDVNSTSNTDGTENTDDSKASVANDISETWITPSMIQAYDELFQEGFAHSVEVWQECTDTNSANNKDADESDTNKKSIDKSIKKIDISGNNTNKTHEIMCMAPLFMTKNEKRYQLVGGLYGVRMGHIFCGESMFHIVPEASRAALQFLINTMKKHEMPLLDSQLQTPHMERMGGREISRKKYLQTLKDGLSSCGTAHASPFFF